MEDKKDGIEVRMEGKDEKAARETFDKVMMSVGRKPNTEGVGLENTKVALTDRGFIQVDADRRTSEPSLFAIGDVAGEPMLAHKGTHDARIAVRTIAGKDDAIEARAMPYVVFSDPEIACAGLTETEARENGQEVKVLKFPWAASGRAATLGCNDGLTKLIVDPESGRILGAGIAGPGSGELLAEATLAIEMGAVAEDLALTVHTHPTLSETLMEAAQRADGRATHFLGSVK